MRKQNDSSRNVWLDIKAASEIVDERVHEAVAIAQVTYSKGRFEVFTTAEMLLELIWDGEHDITFAFVCAANCCTVHARPSVQRTEPLSLPKPTASL